MTTPKTCWILTEPLIGLQNQAKGLAEAMGLSWELKGVAAPALPWKFLPPRFWPKAAVLAGSGIDPARAAWPDVAITAGKKGVAASLAVREASGGKTFTVHIQDPHMDPAAFGCVVVAQHDKTRGANVLATQGAMHHVTPAKLEAAKAGFAEIYAHLPRPLFSVLVGGTSKHGTVTAATFRDLGEKLARLAKSTGGSIALTPSRRTGKENEAILGAALKDVPAHIWDGSGENPYFGMLALADAIVATDDSVSMVSEACSTGKPVYIYSLDGRKSRKIGGFMNALIEKSYARAFDGTFTPFTPVPLEDTKGAAAFALGLYSRSAAKAA